MTDWPEQAKREEARYRDGEARLPEAADEDTRQRQLTRMGNAAGGAGLAYLMAGDADRAREWFDRAVDRYRESFAIAPPGSWGRPIGMIKARVFAGDWPGAESESRWTLEQGAADAETPIGRYAGCLALLVLGRDAEARVLADGLRTHPDFPAPVGDALAFIAAQDTAGYVLAIESVLESFENRDEYLEDLPVADTVMVLQSLAACRDMAAELSSPLLPA
ncbi:MAG TPA: hypothetical protein VF891_09340 [Gaiellaceae bacterium]